MCYLKKLWWYLLKIAYHSLEVLIPFSVSHWQCQSLIVLVTFSVSNFQLQSLLVLVTFSVSQLQCQSPIVLVTCSVCNLYLQSAEDTCSASQLQCLYHQYQLLLMIGRSPYSFPIGIHAYPIKQTNKHNQVNPRENSCNKLQPGGELHRVVSHKSV